MDAKWVKRRVDLQTPGALLQLPHDDHSPDGTVDRLPKPACCELAGRSDDSAVSSGILVPEDGEDLVSILYQAVFHKILI